MCLPVYNCLSVCLRICSAPVQKHVGSQYVIFHFVLANKLFWWVCQYRKSCQYVVNLILMSVQKNTLFASIFFFHTVCQYIFFSFCTGIGKCWYASTKKSILYWHEDRDFYDGVRGRWLVMTTKNSPAHTSGCADWDRDVRDTGGGRDQVAGRRRAAGDQVNGQAGKVKKLRKRTWLRWDGFLCV